MDVSKNIFNNFAPKTLLNDAQDYFIDTFQRSLLYMDTLRKRGNIYFEHLAADQPPVLTFDYKIIVDGKTLEKPVNYSLVRILGRRHRSLDADLPDNKRGYDIDSVDSAADATRRPIVIMDPRAGHGPGIGGSKRDSEIGMALIHGHPVYFIIFSPRPQPGQKLQDVQQATVKFLEKIVNLHPEAGKPAIIGNCQAGWAAALIAAERPDVAGPMVFNGSPLSYWAGVEGKYPMRYKGGLVGGTWMASFYSDLGNGLFDGANIVAGFEDLNPANTLWKKQYNLYTNIDKEESRYLEFERWWNGFFLMNAEEIHFIISNLFVGNMLEQGLLEMDEERIINLKNIDDPILVFASSGDNITPPQQALNWIVKVWGSVEEIKKDNKVLVYLLHDTIGHLGIFVSGQVSRKEHKEIIGSIDLIGYLSPGLYEMVIIEGKDKIENGDYEVSFEEREIDDILGLDDGVVDDIDFQTVATVSETMDTMYRNFVSPFVKMASNDVTAEVIRQLHPLRWTKNMFSDLTPGLYPIKLLAPAIKAHRKIASKENIFVKLEKQWSEQIADSLDQYRDARDFVMETTFRTIYGNPFLQWMFSEDAPDDSVELSIQKDTSDQDLAALVDKGGFMEGILRIMVAMAGSDHIFQREELKLIRKLILSYNVLSKTTEPNLKLKLKQQARILQVDREKAIEALPKLIRGAENRLVAIEIADLFVSNDFYIKKESKTLLKKIRKLLEDRKTLE
ncbi:MAG: DUF3141 domain-containing protein [Proteobacteria bacterium]|nr:DUF3141 domain-containing protein [Pseudomonadota bacterium]